MQLPTWFIVFIVLGLLVLVTAILVFIKPAIWRINTLQNQSEAIDLCKRWTQERCDEESAILLELENKGFCSDFDSCLKLCSDLGMCW